MAFLQNNIPIEETIQNALQVLIAHLQNMFRTLSMSRQEVVTDRWTEELEITFAIRYI